MKDFSCKIYDFVNFFSPLKGYKVIFIYTVPGIHTVHYSSAKGFLFLLIFYVVFVVGYIFITQFRTKAINMISKTCDNTGLVQRKIRKILNRFIEIKNIKTKKLD